MFFCKDANEKADLMVNTFGKIISLGQNVTELNAVQFMKLTRNESINRQCGKKCAEYIVHEYILKKTPCT